MTTLSPPVAQQAFGIGAALAVGLSGVILMRRLSTAREVPTQAVVGATLLSVMGTVSAALILARAGKK